LGTDFGVRKTSGREEWNLLTTGNGDHGINGRDTGLDHLLWIDSLIWINGLSLDIEELLGEYWRALIDWRSGTIEHSTKHFNAHGHAEDITREFTSSVQVINSCGAFENLYDGLLSLDLEDLALSDGAVS
jgi:hypothetical protein